MRALAVLISLILLSSVTSCSSSTTEGTVFELVEFSINGPNRLAAGSESVNVTNSGQYPHTLVVTDSRGEVVAATSLVQPGESTALALDLEPGRYSFTCRIVAQAADGEIIDHFEAGMNRTVTVEG